MRDNFFCWTASVFCLTVPTATITQRLSCCYIVILLYIKIVYSFIIKMQLSLAAIKLIIKKNGGRGKKKRVLTTLGPDCV